MLSDIEARRQRDAVTAGLTLRLFVNDRELRLGDVPTDYREPDDYGYYPAALSAWNGSDHPPVTFTLIETRGRVFGWFLTRGSELVAAERFVGAVMVRRGGAKVTVRVEVATSC